MPSVPAIRDRPATDAENGGGRFKRVLRSVDCFQQRHSWAGFSFGVFKKFGDDSAGSLAALIAYYGFFSLFPLLLVLVTVLATVLKNNPDLQERILDSALAQFPVVGDQIRENIHSLNGSLTALLVGIGGALWGGLGVMKAAGNAMDSVWEVPKRARPSFVRSIVRAVLMLVVLGGGVVATTLLAGATAGSDGAVLWKVLGLVAAGIVNIAIFLVGFRVLTVHDVGIRDLFPGAVLAGLAWLAMQSVGGYFVTHQLRGASQTYGTFAVVIGLLTWLYLQAQVTLIAAELNVVRHRHLWPRSLTPPPFTEADKEAYRQYAEVEERRPEEEVEASLSSG